jgi:hypothetical protein
MKFILLFLSMMTLSACAPINTHFSCHETARDRCLSIEEVNAMTDVELQMIDSCHACKKNESHHV